MKTKEIIKAAKRNVLSLIYPPSDAWALYLAWFGTTKFVELGMQTFFPDVPIGY